MIFKGKVHKVGDHVDTDAIIPARYLVTSDPKVLGEKCMSGLDPEWVKQVEKGDILVAGRNFGCGSSREQAAEVLVANGVHCVIAKSFARIFFRNAINNGILLLECQDLADHVKEGDTIQIDLDNQKITADGKTYAIPAIPENLYHIIMDGGLVKSIMKKVEKGLL